ncbi:MAG TPA: methyltransferase domain-containing protein [Sphingomicrobium sp.]|nr:methyltransferase domain-containing protein [Sphingomicrobium sp.]
MAISEFDMMIHAERSALLRSLPKGAQIFCSAGCSGKWYFDWIDQEYGPVKLHYGVELYSPKPEGLPPHVRWIENSVSDMPEVPTRSVDLLFSGQNIEHLYRDDLHGFLKEANRVVRNGGYICLDSPNRSISQDAGYTQPQHVLELTVAEAVTLVESAGFEIERVNGIWLCADGLRRFGDVTEMTGDVDLRRTKATDSPEASFIWWIVGRKTASPSPDLAARIDHILVRSFPPFVASRFRQAGGMLHSVEGTDAILETGSGEQGYIFYGPYIPLREGAWEASFEVKFLGPDGSLNLDVVSSGGQQTHASLVTQPGKKIGQWQHFVLPFDLTEYTEGIETRVHAAGARAQLRFGAGLRRR